MKERDLKKRETIKLLEEARYIVGKLPEDVSIVRLFLHHDGVGIVLGDNIHDAAAAMGKPVEEVKIPVNGQWRFLAVRTGRGMLYQFDRILEGRE